jgi:hypothetical protein
MHPSSPSSRLVPSLALLLLAGCGEVNSQPAGDPAAATARDSGGALAAAADASSSGARAASDSAATPPVVRGLYINRHWAQSARRMRQLVAIADSTEVNALVIDMKDEFGLNFASKDTVVSRNRGAMGVVPDLDAMLDTLEAHGIVSIARLVVFKDSVAARRNPTHVIRTRDGAPWRDKQGLTWVNPYDRAIWEYNIRVAEEMARRGFDEIQFDYIRFPEPYRSLPEQVFPGANGMPKPDALVAFLKEACPRVRRAGARCTADVFGLVTTVRGALEIGQQWEKLAPVVDVLLPMTYPSHYPPGSFGIARPNAAPYEIQKMANAKAIERNAKIGLAGERVRPWLQAFTLGKPPYGAAEIEAQKRGVYDAGIDGWILWAPGSRYDSFVAGLERELVSRKKSVGTPTVAQDTAARDTTGR